MIERPHDHLRITGCNNCRSAKREVRALLDDRFSPHELEF